MITKGKKIPENSALKEVNMASHYVDSFQSEYLEQISDYDILGIGRLFFSCGPKWADNLMLLRDKIVGVFGLKTSSQINSGHRNINTFKFEPGEQLDIFRLYDKTENELILGEDDKHLNFRFSLLLDSHNIDVNHKRIVLTTLVEYKNLFGRLYFLPVKPFHQLIVKATLKDMIRKIVYSSSHENHA